MFCVCHITSECNKSSFRKLIQLEPVSEVTITNVSAFDGCHCLWDFPNTLFFLLKWESWKGFIYQLSFLEKMWHIMDCRFNWDIIIIYLKNYSKHFHIWIDYFPPLLWEYCCASVFSEKALLFSHILPTTENTQENINSFVFMWFSHLALTPVLMASHSILQYLNGNAKENHRTENRHILVK